MLTPKQERFAIEYSRTGSATEAYRLSYNCAKMKPETIHKLAFQQLRHPKITTRIRELAQEQNQPAIADTFERQRYLTSVMRDENEETTVRIHACDKLAKMQGDYLTNINLNMQEPGVMIVPVIGDGGLDDWEKAVMEQQRKLKAEVRL